MNKPSFFTLKDILSVGLVPIASTILTIAMLFSLPFGEFLALMITVSVVSWAIFIRFLLLKKAELDKFTYIPGNKYALMVNYNGYRGATDSKILGLVETTLNAWSAVFTPYKVRKAIKEKLIWVTFEEMPIKLPGRIHPVAGYTPYKTSKIFVGYKDKYQKLELTAFEHELGHIIQAGVTSKWDETEHHIRSSQHNVK